MGETTEATQMDTTTALKILTDPAWHLEKIATRMPGKPGHEIQLRAVQEKGEAKKFLKNDHGEGAKAILALIKSKS